MPAEWSRIGQEVEEVNDIGGNLLDPSGMLGWIDAKVRHLPGHELPLGAKKAPPPGYLYESYVGYAESHGLDPPGYCSFGDVLED